MIPALLIFIPLLIVCVRHSTYSAYEVCATSMEPSKLAEPHGPIATWSITVEGTAALRQNYLYLPDRVRAGHDRNPAVLFTVLFIGAAQGGKRNEGRHHRGSGSGDR